MSTCRTFGVGREPIPYMVDMATMRATTAPAVNPSNYILAYTALAGFRGLALLTVVSALPAGHGLLTDTAVCMHRCRLFIDGSYIGYPRVIDDLRSLVPELMFMQHFDVG